MKGAIILAVGSLALAGCTSKEQTEANAAKAYAAGKMKDPSSVQFRNLKYRLAVICGEFNAKNSFGAYTGFERFQATDRTLTMESEQRANLERFPGKHNTEFWQGMLDRFDREYKECQSEGAPVT